MTHDELLAYYSAPGIFTGVEGFEAQVDALPGDVASISRAVQGLLIHEAMAQAYQVTLPPERAGEKQLHSTVAMLTCATQLDGRAVNEARPPSKRVAGVCRHFATMFVAFMRHKGVPARARCGFAGYFEPGKHTDHWVGEYWNANEDRWVLVDAQMDRHQIAFFRPPFDTLDVPRDQFLVAGDAWRMCRSGAADPMTFGVAGTEMWGLVEVFGDVFQDLAALQSIELLPWGWYGLAKDERAAETEAALVDELAALSAAADAPAIDTGRARPPRPCARRDPDRDRCR
ncbi:MAG: transglutaminase domain-containing protein [Aromatoleum sp.]|nr:transglutaminase domain-containing protein [Aromatoleum sp.]